VSKFQQRVFGKYTLLEHIAVGGMAEIFKAKTLGYGGFEKVLAIKRLHPQYSDDHNFVKMLVDEAKIAVLLQHSNIVQILDLGRIGRHYYIAMEFVEGRDLFQVLRLLHQNDWQMPIQAAAYVISNISQGLYFAHTQTHPATGKPLNVVHRDVSPQNVLLSWAGEVKLADFGIVKADQRSTVTEAGVIKGKFYYMSPEQARGTDVDARSDVFSAGIVLFEALTSRPLYDDAESETLLEQVQNGPSRRPSDIRKDIPQELEDICMKALQVKPADRYQDALELSRALANFLMTQGAAYTSADFGNYLVELYREPTNDDLLDQAHTDEVPIEDTVEDTDAAAILHLTSDDSSLVIGTPPANVSFDGRDTDLHASKSGISAGRPKQDPPQIDDAHRSVAGEVSMLNMEKTAAISIHDLKMAAVQIKTTQPEKKIPVVQQKSQRRPSSSPPVTPGKQHNKKLSLGEQTEMRLKMALTAVVVAIICVIIAIAYVLAAPIELPPIPRQMKSNEVATQPLPAPTSPTKNPVATPTGKTEPVKINPESGAESAQIKIVTQLPNQRYRLYLNGKLIPVEKDLIAVPAGRHTIRARLRPQGSWTADQVVEVNSGAKITVKL